MSFYRRGRSSVPLLVACAVFVAAAIAGWLLTRPPSVELPPETRSIAESGKTLPQLTPPPDDYVGSRKCAECHADLAGSYQTHPMSRAAAPIGEAVVVEDYDQKNSFSTVGRLVYRVERDGADVRHCERMVDADGETIFEQAVPVHFAIGSGQRGRSYATQRDGMLFMSPIGWYSNKACWDLSPGYTPLAHERFERRLKDSCIHCHMGRVDDVPERPDTFRGPVVLEGGISCERCHGPGGQHVAHHESPADDRVGDRIVNPAELEPVRRDHVCYQCHLQGAGRVLRYGRSEYDFRPGMLLSDVWVPFVEGTRVTPEGSTNAVSHVEQMRSSRCFQQSGGRLGCISCHDPHGKPAEEAKVAFFRNRCLNCHDDGMGCDLPADQRIAASPGDSCVECHMPALSANDVPHTSQTDHRILRNSSSEADSQPDGDHSTARLFADARGHLPEAAIERAKGLILIESATEMHDQLAADDALTLLLPLMESNPDDLVVKEAVGDAYAIHGHWLPAQELWMQVFHAAPRRESVLEKLAFSLHDRGMTEEGLVYLDRLITVNPWRADYHGRRAHMLGQIGELRPAIEAARRCLELNPFAPQVHAWLADAYRTAGNPELARQHDQLQVRIEENLP